MNRARRDILESIRRGVRGAKSAGAEALASVETRLVDHPRSLIPARVNRPPLELRALFVQKAEGVAATVTQVPDLDDVPIALANYLADHNLPPRLKRAPHPLLDSVPWGVRPTLTVESGIAEDGDEVAVAVAFAGVAETGTLVLISGPNAPTSLNFLPDTHIVVLLASDIVGPYEEAWDRVRALGVLPRTVNWITGPSRTGDIEQTIQLGAHGPRQLHIVLIDGA